MGDTDSVTERMEVPGAVVIDFGNCESMRILGICSKDMVIPLIPRADPEILIKNGLKEHEIWHRGTDRESIARQLGHQPMCDPVVTIRHGT